MDFGQIDLQQLAQAQARGAMQPDGEGCLALFYDRAVQDEDQTRIEGRPVYRNLPYVRITIAGQRNTVVDEPVHDSYAQPGRDPRLRWPKAWEGYLAKRPGLADGTPIEEWPLLNPAQVAELKAGGILAVEQLATMSDAGLGRLGMGARELRERARQFLQPAPDVERALRAEVQQQAHLIADLSSKIDQLMGQQRAEEAAPAPAAPKAKKAA